MLKSESKTEEQTEDECKHEFVMVKIWVMENRTYKKTDKGYNLESKEPENTDWGTSSAMCSNCYKEINTEKLNH